MTTTQRIIKYCAIAFAFFIVFNILSAITYGVGMFSSIFNDNEVEENLKDLDVNENVSILEVNLRATNLKIKSGDYFKAETNNKYINIKQDDNNLYINEKKGLSFSSKNNDLIIYIPDYLILDLINISAGAGKIDINSLSAKKLNLDLGAGNTTINNLNIEDKAKIEGGIGKFEILNGNINNLNLSLGVGKSVLNAKIFGKSEIEAGVGSTELKLNGNKEDYKISVEKGMGSINIDGVSVKNETIHGNGINAIDVEGGIGNIDIKFSK